jgi:hypothetical protein
MVQPTTSVSNELQPNNSDGETFSAMQSQWHINMIRVFIYPSWYYRDNIVPAQEDSNYASSTTPISTKAYLQTLCNEAAKIGIYVDIVPYMLTPYSGSFAVTPMLPQTLQEAKDCQCQAGTAQGKDSSQTQDTG